MQLTEPPRTPPIGDEDDRGSVSLELAVLAPALLLLIGLLIFAGRTELAQQSVQQAAADAARQASIALDANDAQRIATTSADQTLADQGLHCRHSIVAVDTSGFSEPVGTPAKITARVVCVIDLSDLAVPGIPGAHTVSATASSVLDTYRLRTGGSP